MGKKHKKCIGKIGSDDAAVNRNGSICIDRGALLRQPMEWDRRNVHEEMILDLYDDAGFFFGDANQKSHYIGMPQGEEGNIVAIGGNGSGKSTGIAMTTFRTWRGPICATDVKGELSEFYKKLYQQGIATRPYVVFDPTEIDGLSYDPFWFPLQDSEDNLFSSIREIAIAIAPVMPDDKQPFWAETEQAVLTAALLYYFKLGLSFSETMCKILSSTMSGLCMELLQSQNIHIRVLLGEMAAMKPETLANVDRGLRNKLRVFAADPHIGHALRGVREGAECFNWNDLEEYNIFLRIPANRIEQWSGAINLMYTQLIRYLERRPEQYSAEGRNNKQTLLLMDEFARFGKLEMITAAMSTLRSKNVNICLMLQSVAQLDKVYGEHDRRIIFDNCQYQAILRVNDAETQKYICELAGTCIHRQHSVGEQMNDSMNTVGYSKQISEVRVWRVFPHELSTLEDILLLTPHGFHRVKKYKPNYMIEKYVQRPARFFNAATLAAQKEAFSIMVKSTPAVLDEIHFKMNEGAVILSIDKRAQNAFNRAETVKHQQRVERREALEAQRKINQHRNYVIGELVFKYFPEVEKFRPGTKDENAVRFGPLEAFLAVLAKDRKLVEEIKRRAHYKCDGAEGQEQPALPQSSDV